MSTEYSKYESRKAIIMVNDLAITKYPNKWRNDLKDQMPIKCPKSQSMANCFAKTKYQPNIQNTSQET